MGTQIRVLSDVVKVWKEIGKEIFNSKISVKSFTKEVLLGGGAFSVIQAGAKSFVQILSAGFEKAKEDFMDLVGSFNDLSGEYEKVDVSNRQRTENDKKSLDVLADLQLQDTPMTNVQQIQQQKAIEQLRKSYSGLQVEIDKTTGKVKNFEDIQNKVMKRDQAAELKNVRDQIKVLAEQNNIALDSVKDDSFFKKLLEGHGKGTSGEANEIFRKNMEKIVELKTKEKKLSESDFALDKNQEFNARKADKEAEKKKQEDEKRKQADEDKRQADAQAEQEKAKEAESRKAEEERRRNEKLEADRKAAEGKKEKEREAAEQKEVQKKAAADYINDKGTNLAGKYLTAAGRGRDSAVMQALAEAESAKGASLDKSEREKVLKLADIEYMMNASYRDVDISKTGVLTNALTQRGGFATGGIVAKSDDINRSILEQNRHQTEIMEKIDSQLRGIGIIS